MSEGSRGGRWLDHLTGTSRITCERGRIEEEDPRLPQRRPALSGDFHAVGVFGALALRGERQGAREARRSEQVGRHGSGRGEGEREGARGSEEQRQQHWRSGRMKPRETVLLG